MYMSINFEDKLNVDLEFFKINMSVDIQFIMYLESLNLENLKVVTYDSYKEQIVKENREKTQYITLFKEIKSVKKLLWFIPWIKFIKEHYIVLAEIQWIKKNDKALTIKIWGEKAYNLLKQPIKNWAEEKEYFVTLDVLNAQNNRYYVSETWKKHVWQDQYKFIKCEK